MDQVDKVKMVQFGRFGTAFLVVNDKAGQPCNTYHNQPVIHPTGYIYFPKEIYPENVTIAGKLFKLQEIEVIEEHIPECEPYKEKQAEAQTVLQECNQIHYRRYERYEGKSMLPNSYEEEGG